MAPVAVEPTTSQLASADIQKTIATSAPSLSKIPSNSTLPELDASLLTISPSKNLKTIPEPDSPAASRCPTDHMVSAEWSISAGWAAPRLHAYAPISLPPTASCLHYATECFEGLKVYRGYDGKLRLFRPSLNCARMLLSSTRVALPAFDPAELEKLIIALCAQDGERWLPKSEPGKYLYIRPTMIGTDADVGIKPPGAAMLFIFLTTLPNLAQMVTTRAQPGLRLLASEDDACRAWPGGFGYAKLGANYGPSLVAQREAAARGYEQILWLFGEQGKVTEAGASNFFVVWEGANGRKEMITAPLEGKIILDGITRRSVLQLARERFADEVDVIEREFTMEEIVQKQKEGKLVEAFACGTAFFVTPVAAVGYKGVDLQIPMSEGKTGRFAGALTQWLVDINYGNVQHDWTVVVDEQNR